MTTEHNRRINGEDGRPVLAGVPVRDDDIEPAKGLHWVARLFRVLAGVLFLLMVVQLLLGFTSAVEISYGILFAEAVRLLIFAGLLLGAAGLADLFVKSHHDVRAARILLSRLAQRLGEEPHGVPPADDTARARGRDDAEYRH